MKTNRPADLARLISERRAELGHTQQQVAEKAGVTRQLVARLENGSGDPAVSSLLRVLDALDIDLHLRARDETAPRGETSAIRLASSVLPLDVSKIASTWTEYFVSQRDLRDGQYRRGAEEQ